MAAVIEQVPNQPVIFTVRELTYYINIDWKNTSLGFGNPLKKWRPQLSLSTQQQWVAKKKRSLTVRPCWLQPSKAQIYKSGTNSNGQRGKIVKSLESAWDQDLRPAPLPLLSPSYYINFECEKLCKLFMLMFMMIDDDWTWESCLFGRSLLEIL